MGGYGGDFASVLTSLRLANAADVVLSTVDTVGLPLVLLKGAGFVRRPVVYTSIGLPERLVQLRGERMRRLYRAALDRAGAIVAYSEHETEWLRNWIGPGSPPVVFLPFAVDVGAFRPDPVRRPQTDVVSVGADPRRALSCYRDCVRRPELSFRIVASAERARPRAPRMSSWRSPLARRGAGASCRRPPRCAAGWENSYSARRVPRTAWRSANKRAHAARLRARGPAGIAPAGRCRRSSERSSNADGRACRSPSAPAPVKQSNAVFPGSAIPTRSGGFCQARCSPSAGSRSRT